MKKKTVKPDRICFECLHYEACQSWNIGSLVGTAADNCVNYRASVNRGKWIDMGDFISCSACNATRLKEFKSDYGKVMRLDARTNFCPNCGADMREES